MITLPDTSTGLSGKIRNYYQGRKTFLNILIAIVLIWLTTFLFFKNYDYRHDFRYNLTRYEIFSIPFYSLRGTSRIISSGKIWPIQLMQDCSCGIVGGFQVSGNNLFWINSILLIGLLITKFLFNKPKKWYLFLLLVYLWPVVGYYLSNMLTSACPEVCF